MSDPRNVAHDKKVIQEKKHHGTELAGSQAMQPGKKRAAAKKRTSLVVAPSSPEQAVAVDPAAQSGNVQSVSVATLEASLAALAQFKEMEFHSRANLERLAKLGLTVEELKQKECVDLVGEVYSAQDTVQKKLTTLIGACQAECDRMQGTNV